MVAEIKKSNVWERREEILRIIETIGSKRINMTELAKKYGVSREQISKDFKAISVKVKTVDKTELNFRFHLIFEFILNELLDIARNNKLTPMNKVKALTALANMVDKKTDNLLKLGLIKPPEETMNVNHSADGELCDLVVEIAQDIRKTKSSKKSSSAKA